MVICTATGYAPTDTSDDDPKDTIFESLERILNGIQPDNVCNRNGHRSHERTVVGHERIIHKTTGEKRFHSKSNNYVLRLVSCAASKGLTILSSIMFSRTEMSKRTWISPDGKIKSQTDHIPVDKIHKIDNGIFKTKNKDKIFII